jgi:hypothetical protein
VSNRVCQGKKEAKNVKRKEERRKIMIGTEERKNGNDNGGVKVHDFTVVKENITQSILISYWNTVFCVVVW